MADTNKYLSTYRAKNGTVYHFKDSRLGSVCDNSRIDDLFPTPPEMVDLGLPSGLLWAKWNIGAKQETDNGLYFKWGDPRGHSAEEAGYFDLPFNTDYSDAATIAYGADYREPTLEECMELINYTDWQVETLNGVQGFVFYSRFDPSKYIFTPLTGYIMSGRLQGTAGFASIWNSDPSMSFLLFNFEEERIRTMQHTRPVGCPIRAVKQP